jgi:hypothetical protein
MALELVAMSCALQSNATAVRSDRSDTRNALFPSDHYTVPDADQLTGLRVALPKPDCSVYVSDCDDIDVINQLDGFNVQPRIAIPFTDAIDLSTVTSRSVFLVEAQSSRTRLPHRIALNQVQWDQLSNTLVGTPDELLQQHRRYLLIVTDDLKDRSGARLESAPFWAAETAGKPTVADRRYASALRAALRGAGLKPEHVAAASLFTTQSVTADLEKIQTQIRRATPSAIDFVIGTDATKPSAEVGASVRTVFAVESLVAIKWHRQTGTGAGSEPLFTDAKVSMHRLGLAPGSIAQIAFGRFFSPDYETGSRTIPAYPTRTGVPVPQRRAPLIVEIFIPAGAKPPKGWPVAIVGHGRTDHLYDDAWAIAPQLAAAGIATAAIHVVGHGGGDRGTLEIVKRDGRIIELPSGGRGIDQNNDGTIGSVEGYEATPPKAIILARDGTRQTVIDLMQLVREIQLGVNIDGDGQPDFDATRISYVGHSAGAIYGTLLLAVEPAIKVGALICPAGSSADYSRLGRFRQIVGRSLAARTPPLLNSKVSEDPAKPSYAFIDNVPLRNQPIATNATSGAMEIQEFFDRRSWVAQPGNAVAYAPYLRASPLLGNPPKRVLVQFAKGDQLLPNPTTTAVIRSGRLADRTTLYRADLAHAANPNAMPKDSHNFLLDGVDTAERPFALAAQRQIAIFLESAGAQTVDPDGDSPIFETPIVGTLPEDLSFLP